MTDEKLFGMSPEKGRWLFVALGLVTTVCLGAVYAYSLFLKPVKEAFADITNFQANLPYMVFLAMFSVTMYFGGRLMDKIGPRNLSVIGSIVVGLGWILSSFAPNIWVLTLTYGVIAGGGVGFVYGCPVAIAARWFPDRKGLAVGLVLVGFGGSALITGKIASILLPSVGLSSTFLYFGIAFIVLLVILSLPFRFPTPGWTPKGWKPVVGTAAAQDFVTGDMIKTSTFWGLFVCFIIGSMAGLMAIGISKPVGKDIINIPDALGATLVGVFAIFNAGGRPLFGFLTDKITPRNAAMLNMALILVVSILMINAKEGDTVIYTISFIGFWMSLGGWLAIAPTSTAAFFGLKNYASNYGTLFFAYGIAAVIGGIISGQAKDVFGSYSYAFYPTAVMAVIGFLLVFLFVKTPVRK